jgi:hypothetical protein
MECHNRAKDWAEIGSRVIRAAAIASAMHQAERARVIASESAEPVLPSVREGESRR